MRYDTIIHNAVIVTVNHRFEVIPRGVVGIEGGRIRYIEADDGECPLPDSAERVDARGGILLPGLINTHTHLPMSLFRGYADDLPLETWLNEHIFPAEAKHINPESVRIGTRLSCAEMLLSGTTTCCDGYFFEEEVARAVSGTGMRAVLGQGVIDFPAPGVPDPADNVGAAERFVEAWKGRFPLLSPAIFCHSPYTCSDKTLGKAKAAAGAAGVLFQIHVAETEWELKEIRSRHGMTPVRYLDSLGILDENTLLVHGIWVDAGDIEIISGRGAKIAHTPESNMKLASGAAPIEAFLKAGIRVGLGTDGCASNNNLDLFQEMDTAAKIHKVHILDPTALDAETVLRMATVNAAAAIGLSAEIGSIEKGKQADLIILETRSPHLVPIYHPVSHLVYAARGSDVRDVMVAGRWVVRNRGLTAMDLEEILDDAVRTADSIRDLGRG